MNASLLQIAVSLLVATLVLLIIFKLNTSSKNKHVNSLDSKKKGKSILIAGPSKAGKTFLFQKIMNAAKIIQTVHSLKANEGTFGKWKVIDLPLDPQKLHSQPADFFHYNDLAGLILCIRPEDLKCDTLELIVIMTMAVGILKSVPLFISAAEPVEIQEFSRKLIESLKNTQNVRLSGLVASENSSISFEDPVNRLIFESADGEVSPDYEDRIKSYFEEFVSQGEDVKEWIESSL